MSIGKLKKLIDKEIGEHAYICIYNSSDGFLCEGIVSELRTNQLWALLDEENTGVSKVFSGTSEHGKKATVIKLHQYPNRRKGGKK